MNRNALTLAAILVGLSFLFSGCATNPMEGRGKVSFTTPHNITTCHDAAISALAELGVDITGDTTDMLVGRIKGLTATNQDVTIDLEPQSIMVTKIDVRVGRLGNQVQSNMIAERIKKRLR